MSEGRQTLAAELKRAFAALPKASDSTAAAVASVEGSISFTMPLLRAVLSGRKTQTRRPIRPAPARIEAGVPITNSGSSIAPIARVGDQLWVREKWARLEDGRFVYAADEPSRRVRWISSRYMPRSAARDFLKVEGIEIERLSAIDEDAALAEGAEPADMMYGPRAWFMGAWNAIYGETEFNSINDPWVWVLRFTLIRSSSDRA